MATLTLIIGSIALFAGAFAAWYTVRRLRVESRFARIPVDDRRSARVLREGVGSGDDRQ
jgi:hypothetical protein